MNKIVCFRYSLHIQKFLESEFYQQGISIILNKLFCSTTLFAQCLPITTSMVQVRSIGSLFLPQPYFMMLALVIIYSPL